MAGNLALKGGFRPGGFGAGAGALDEYEVGSASSVVSNCSSDIFLLFYFFEIWET